MLGLTSRPRAGPYTIMLSSRRRGPGLGKSFRSCPFFTWAFAGAERGVSPLQLQCRSRYRCVREIRKGTREVIARNVWTLPAELSFLSVGNDLASGGAGAFLSAQAARILAVGHLSSGDSWAPWYTSWRRCCRTPVCCVTPIGDMAGSLRISVVETAILDNPSAANFEELGELYWDEKQYAKAKEAFDHAIATR